MNIKQKITLGISFLFLLLLLTGGVCIYYLVKLRDDARIILKDNYESLEFGHGMLRQLDSMAINHGQSHRQFDVFLEQQENNITEAGEQAATNAIRKYFDLLKTDGEYKKADMDSIRIAILQVLDVNMAAITRKNQRAEQTADEALVYISMIATVIFLLSFGFIINFPSYIANPVAELTQGIKAVANKDYQKRIYIESSDEFGQLARAFNLMAQKLDEFEHSNLAQIMFEKTRAEAVINSLRDAGVGVDSRGIVLFANQQALQLLNLTAPEVVGKEAKTVAARNDLFRFLVDPSRNTTVKIVVDGKENFFVRNTDRIMRDNLELGTVFSLINITTFQEKDIAKTNFLATISHELKTPLASTDIGLKLLENNKTGGLNEAQREIIEDLKNDNQRLIRLVSELLDVTQVEAGNINLNVSEWPLTEVLNYALDTVKNQANEKNVELMVKLPDPPPVIKADKEKAAWVLVNLLSNALRYTPEKTSVLVEAETTQSKMVKVRVSDSGPGIPPEYRGQIFQRFFTVPNGKQGSGLGLAISKEFMEALGGSIRLVNTDAGGAVFEVEFVEA